MNRVLLLVVAVLLLAIAWPGVGLAHEGGAQPRQIQGRSADAAFASTDGCLVTEVFVSASDSVGHQPPGPPTRTRKADIFIRQYDRCTGSPRSPLLAAMGTLFDPDFQVDPRLRGATLVAAIPVTDDVSGASFTVAVNLTWVGVGDLTGRPTHWHVRTDDTLLHVHANNRHRDAVASGTVAVGATNYTPAPTADAHLELVREGHTCVRGDCD